MTNIINFFAMEGYGAFVWTALMLTIISMLCYLGYLSKKHTKIIKKIAHLQSTKHKPENSDDT